MKSYESVDYRLRVRKFIERKMIKESCQRLFYFDKLDDYMYIGFGSLYFVDYKLFHKELNISDMISIELEENLENQFRFEFNKPYDFIKMKYKKSTEALNEIDFDKRSIVWLDYDDNLQEYMFNDIDILFNKMMSGSIFIMSLNSSINGRKTSKLVIELNRIKDKLKSIIDDFYMTQCDKTDKCEILLAEILTDFHRANEMKFNKKKLQNYCKKLEVKLDEYLKLHRDLNVNETNDSELYDIITNIIRLLRNEDNCREKNIRVEKFKSEYNGYLTRQTYKEADLTDKNSHAAIKEMFDEQIRKKLHFINNFRSEENKLIYKQLYYFTYKDGANMLTFGGIIYEKREEEYYNKACFENIPFIRSGNEHYRINIPKLTDKEMEYFNNPFANQTEIAMVDSLSKLEEEISLYKEMYRYMPHFINGDHL